MEETGAAEAADLDDEHRESEQYEPDKILARASHTAAEWAKRMEAMETQEITKGSRWLHDEDEFKPDECVFSLVRRALRRNKRDEKPQWPLLRPLGRRRSILVLLSAINLFCPTPLRSDCRRVNTCAPPSPQGR